MFRNLVLIMIVAGVSTAVPVFYRDHPEAFEALFRAALGNGHGEAGQSISVAAKAEVVPEPAALSGRRVRIEAGPQGHFIADFRLNGRRMEAMIDTGASIVAINETMARRIGIHLAPADFKYTVNTANGATKAAAAKIDRLEIGRIEIDNVEAAVLDDRALDNVLIGMSFLKRLQRYQVEGGALVLEQ